MSEWYQWFIAAPMITIDFPRVRWALSANSRASRIACAAGTPVIRSCHAGVYGTLSSYVEATLPRRPDLMSIDSSDLQADPRREGLIVLNAVIRNRARFAQDYPALELTLTDEGDRPVLRRVLAPRDYLETARASAQIAEGVAPGSETALRVFLDAGRTRATGYRLYLFYPS